MDSGKPDDWSMLPIHQTLIPDNLEPLNLVSWPDTPHRLVAGAGCSGLVLRSYPRVTLPLEPCACLRCPYLSPSGKPVGLPPFTTRASDNSATSQISVSPPPGLGGDLNAQNRPKPSLAGDMFPLFLRSQWRMQMDLLSQAKDTYT